MTVFQSQSSHQPPLQVNGSVRPLSSWQLLVAGVGGSAALCGGEVRVSRLLSGVIRLGRLLMNQSTPSRPMPLPLWVTVGFYPCYLILLLGLCYWTPVSEGLFKMSPYVLCMAMMPVVMVRLLSGKPFGRVSAILVGGVALPVVGVALLVIYAIHGGQPDDPPAWFVVLLGVVFVLGGIWHWWALTRPAVRQWFASSQPNAIPAEGGS
jgi:hypothetical protein